MPVERTVRRNEEERQFEMPLGQDQVAFIRYRDDGQGVVRLIHTDVPAGFEGQGIGGALVKGTLELIRQRNQKIVPVCPFVRSYLQRHSEYGELVVAQPPV